MSELDRIVEIQLTRGSTPVETASFQIPLVLATHTKFADRSRVYTDFSAVKDDFDSVDKVYQIAQKLFGQTTVGARPPSIVVGRRQVDSVAGSVTVANSTEYKLTIAGPASVVPSVITFTSDANATAAEIVAGLKAAYDLTPVTGVNLVDNLDGTFTAAVVTSGANWSIVGSSRITLVNTATETYPEALEAVSDDNSTWYGLLLDTHDAAIVEAVSDALQAQRKLMGTSTADLVAIATGTTDIAYKLSAKTADRTYGVYLPTADTEWPEAAWMGAQLAYTPGSNDWDKKRAVGVTRSKLNDTARVNLRNKKCNMYTRVAGVDIFQDGDTFGGSPIDEIVFLDWLYARLQEGVYFRLINTLKVPMTNAGLLMIENEIRAVLSQAEANGGIARGWTISTPDVLSIPENLRAQRIAGAFVFRARLAGSVRRVRIEGFLSV
jgi:hypothetical protein